MKVRMIKATVIIVVALVGAGILFYFNQFGYRVNGSVRSNSPTARQNIVYVNDIPVTVKSNGRTAKAYLKNDFSNSGDLNEYIEKRKDLLSRIAAADPHRKIEVVISPSSKLPLKEFKEKSDIYDLTIEEMALDLFVGEKWSRMAQFDATSTVIDISQDAESIEKRIIELEAGNSPRMNVITKLT